MPVPGCTLEPLPGGWRARFSAMASPCELLLDGGSEALACQCLQLACGEAWRIEHRYSRYRPDSEVARIHAAQGQPVRVDDETARLLDYAASCHAASEGRFDITSGVLRRAWRFESGATVPAPAQVDALLAQVGWGRVQWRAPWLTLPAGMEIDLGGIGKEYAVDRVLVQLREAGAPPVLVNFGGDLAVSGPRADGSAWQVGIQHPDGTAAAATDRVALASGALATSGDARRHVWHGGRRYGHVLDARTGWPVPGAPRSVTVAAPSCTEAGTLATLALLQGAGARAWLQAQGAPHHILD
jgi:FAD:protein FMN transferase